MAEAPADNRISQPPRRTGGVLQTAKRYFGLAKSAFRMPRMSA